MMKKTLMTLAAVLCCAMTLAVLTACSVDDNPVNPTSGVDGKIVGNWCSDVSGKTFVKWTYGPTWQNSEFKADGTGKTRIYYTYKDRVIGIEKIDFIYTASADGVLTMTSADRGVTTAKWQVVGDELRLSDDAAISASFKKSDSDMLAQFDAWSKTQNCFDVPKPAKYTVFVYGNAEGKMDVVIEDGFWTRTQQFLTDHDNVRVICMYKYGKENPDFGYTGKYADQGDIVWFELTDKTDLNTIKEGGMQAIGMGEEAKQLKICNPNTMRLFLDVSSLVCPAEDYVLAIWGHGCGFDPKKDIPGKYELLQPVNRGVMADEWNDDEWMDMYEMGDALKAAGIDRLNTLYFHNCFMGNMETLTQARNFADYIFASSHILSSDGLLLTEFVRGLMEKGNAVDAGTQMFERSWNSWHTDYVDAKDNLFWNGEFKMIRTDKFDAIIDASKRLADRVIALYPTQQEAIDRATRQVYRYDPYKAQYENPFFDLADYAHQLANETQNAEFKAISDAMDKAFQEAFVCYRDISYSKQHLDHYTLSVCLLDNKYYTADYVTKVPQLGSLCNFNVGYEQCDFHKLTGWGNWLNMNQQALDSNPQKGGGGPLEVI